MGRKAGKFRNEFIRHGFVILLALTSVSSRKTQLTWVNGVGYNLAHMEEGQQVISKLFGGK
jgi:hypothetical protein